MTESKFLMQFPWVQHVQVARVYNVREKHAYCPTNFCTMNWAGLEEIKGNEMHQISKVSLVKLVCYLGEDTRQTT